LITRGAAQFGLEQYEDAAMTFERAVNRNPDNELPLIYLASSYGHLDRIKDADDAIEAANDLRGSLGLGDLSLEKNENEWYSPFEGEIDFKRFGGRPAQERVRAGLSEIPALTWQYLVTPHPVSGVGNTWWEIEGATNINVGTAKSLHDRGVVFIDVSPVRVWNEGHIPGSINRPFRDKDLPTKDRLTEATLMEIVDKTEEVVFLCECRGTVFISTKAVNWGFTRVYFQPLILQRWKKAGYPVETVQ